LDKKAIDALLKFGAYDLLNKDDEESNKFRESDIDQILERAKTVVHKVEEAGVSNFSKASFASNSTCSFSSFSFFFFHILLIFPLLFLADPELDINDPDFWKKLMPEASNAPNPLIQTKKRERRTVKRGYVNIESESESSSSSEIEEDVEEGNLWNYSQSTALRKALLQFGYGRWKDIQLRSGLTAKQVRVSLGGRRPRSLCCDIETSRRPTSHSC
jgi:hypothetical protein